MPRSSAKRDAILAIGLDRPTTEILAAAAASGVTVSRAYVDILKKGGGQGSAPTQRGKRSAAGPTNARSPATSPDVDAAFRAAAVALVLQGGMDAAHKALADVVAQIRGAIA